MAEVKLTTGKQTIDIIRDGVVAGSISFSPGDTALLSRLREVGKKAEEIQQKNAQADGERDLDEALDLAREQDKELRRLIDYAFDYPCSDVVFGANFAFTTDSGVTLLEQFLQGVIPYIEQALEKEYDAAQKNVDKYVKKYRK